MAENSNREAGEMGMDTKKASRTIRVAIALLSGCLLLASSQVGLAQELPLPPSPSGQTPPPAPVFPTQPSASPKPQELPSLPPANGGDLPPPMPFSLEKQKNGNPPELDLAPPPAPANAKPKQEQPTLDLMPPNNGKPSAGQQQPPAQPIFANEKPARKTIDQQVDSSTPSTFPKNDTPAFRLIGPYKEKSQPPVAVGTPTNITSYKTPITNSSDPTPGQFPTDISMDSNDATISKRGPKTGTVGQLLDFSVSVSNKGKTALTDLRIEDLIPTGLELVGSLPPGKLDGNKLVWTIANLRPGESANFGVRCKATRTGSINHETSLYVRQTAQFVTQIEGPNVGLELAGLAPTNVGAKAKLGIEITNRNAQALNNVILHVSLGSGLGHPANVAGQGIEAEITIPANSKKNIDLDLETLQPGDHPITVVVRSGKETLAQRSAIVPALNSQPVTTANRQENVRTTPKRGNREPLLLKKHGPQTIAQDQEVTYRLEVINRNNGEDAERVVVTEYILVGLEFVAASNGGEFDPKSRTVRWILPSVRGGQTYQLGLKLKGKSVGPVINRVAVEAIGWEPVSLTANLMVQESQGSAQNPISNLQRTLFRK